MIKTYIEKTRTTQRRQPFHNNNNNYPVTELSFKLKDIYRTVQRTGVPVSWKCLTYMLRHILTSFSHFKPYIKTTCCDYSYIGANVQRTLKSDYYFLPQATANEKEK